MDKPGNEIIVEILKYLLEKSEYSTLAKIAEHVNCECENNITEKQLSFYMNKSRPAKKWLIEVLTSIKKSVE